MNKLIHQLIAQATLIDKVVKYLHTLIAGMLAFTIILNSSAFGAAGDTYRVTPDVYQHSEQVVKDQDLGIHWLGYHLMPNHTTSMGYLSFFKMQNLKLPSSVQKVISEAQRDWTEMRKDGKPLTPVELRHRKIEDVNSWVNDHIQYQEFAHGYRTPQQIFTEKTQDGYWFGDCKDYVIAKMSILNQLGFKAEDIVVVFGTILENHVPDIAPGSFGHVILGVRMEAGGKALEVSVWQQSGAPGIYAFLDSNAPTIKYEFTLSNPGTGDGSFHPLVMINSHGANNLLLFHAWDLNPNPSTKSQDAPVLRNQDAPVIKSQDSPMVKYYSNKEVETRRLQKEKNPTPMEKELLLQQEKFDKDANEHHTLNTHPLSEQPHPVNHWDEPVKKGEFDPSYHPNTSPLPPSAYDSHSAVKKTTAPVRDYICNDNSKQYCK